ADGRAEVFCELSRSEHDERVRASAVYVLCLKDGGPSAGHVRLMAVVDCGTPVIATAVRGLEGYVDRRSAILVPPGDPERLGADVSASEPRSRASSIARKRSSASSGANRRPTLSSSMISGQAPERAATAGVPAASDSISTSPNASSTEGRTLAHAPA